MSSGMDRQSLTTSPSKPHSSRRTWVRRNRLAVAGIPFRSLNEVITVAAPASSAALKGGRCTLRSSPSGMFVVL